MNVFVLNTGRCGSTTFFKACEHITNYSAGHETRSKFVGYGRLGYSENHIEVDNRLSWFLGRLDFAYGDSAFYVHLFRNIDDVLKSFEKRIRAPSIIHAYKTSICMGSRNTTDRKVCEDYYNTVNQNIALFLKDKTRKMKFYIDLASEMFGKFWEEIGAEGDFKAAMKEFSIRYNQ